MEDFKTKQDLLDHLLAREDYWIKELRTLTPFGLNSKLNTVRHEGTASSTHNTLNRISGQAGNRGKGLILPEHILNFSPIKFFEQMVKLQGTTTTTTTPTTTKSTRK